MHLVTLTPKNYSASNVSSAEADKPCSRSEYRENGALSGVTRPRYVGDKEKAEVAGIAQNKKIVIRQVGAIHASQR